MDTLAVIITLLIIFTPFVLIIYFAFRYQRKIFVSSWINVCELLAKEQAKITSATPADTKVPLKISAEIKDLKLQIENDFLGRGRGKTPITRIRISGMKNMPDLQVSRENVFTRIGEKIGIEDVKTGDETFDKIYRLSISESHLISFFDLSVRNEFVNRKKDVHGTITSRSNEIEAIYFGAPSFKLGYRHFTALFELSLLLAQKGK